MKIDCLTAAAALAAFASVPAFGAFVLPTSGTLTVQAEDYDSQAGTSFVAGPSANSTGTGYVDSLEDSDAGAGTGDFIEFDVSGADAGLTYEITLYTRRNGGGNNAGISAFYEIYSSTDGISYVLETTVETPWQSNGWSADFSPNAGAASFALDAGTTHIRIESAPAAPANGIAHFDKLEITAVPEPGSLALLGLGGLLMSRRRRG